MLHTTRTKYKIKDFLICTLLIMNILNAGIIKYNLFIYFYGWMLRLIPLSYVCDHYDALVSSQLSQLIQIIIKAENTEMVVGLSPKPTKYFCCTRISQAHRLCLLFNLHKNKKLKITDCLCKGGYLLNCFFGRTKIAFHRS